jgi:hypothetical protein
VVNKLFVLVLSPAWWVFSTLLFLKVTTYLLYISITVNTIKNAESSSPAVSSLYEGRVLYSTLALF